MPKELYLYSGIYSWTAESIISELNEYMDEEVIIRLNSPGGSVFDGYGILSKMKEHGNVTIILDGMAASMGAFILPFAKKVIAYDMAKVMLHRADMYVGDDEEYKKLLANINKDLREKLLAKVDKVKFKEVTGYTIDEMFDSEKRQDIWMSAKEAKKIGLVDEVKKMTPEAYSQIAAMFNPKAQSEKPKKQSNLNSNTMTKEELQAKFPELYNSIVADSVQQEKDRVEAWLTYMDVDAEAVKAGINSGKAPSLKEQTELNRKAIAQATVNNLEKGNPEDVTPAGQGIEAPKAEANKELADLEAQMDEILNLKSN